MKSIFKVSLAALSLAFAVSSQAADKLVVATDTAFVPFEFKQGDKYVGFDVDLWAAVAKELKLDYTLKPMDFSGIIPALQTKNVDLALAGITITDERKKAIDFSDGYYKSGLLVMVKADNNDVKSVKDLDGKVVAVKSGTGSVDYANSTSKPKTCVSSRTSTTRTWNWAPTALTRFCTTRQTSCTSSKQPVTASSKPLASLWKHSSTVSPSRKAATTCARK